MAKDPAFLFYSGDFLTGTYEATYVQRGVYITLLCVQHQKSNGEIPIKFFDELVGEDTFIRNKFIKTDTGYYNERLRQECDRRKKYSDSRRKNICKRYEPTYVVHMETETETETINLKKKKQAQFVKPTLEEVTQYIVEAGYTVDPNKFFNYYESNGWKVGKNPMKNWKAALSGTWQARDGTKVLVQKFGKQAVDNMDALKRFNEKMELKQIGG